MKVLLVAMTTLLFCLALGLADTSQEQELLPLGDQLIRNKREPAKKEATKKKKINKSRRNKAGQGKKGRKNREKKKAGKKGRTIKRRKAKKNKDVKKRNTKNQKGRQKKKTNAGKRKKAAGVKRRKNKNSPRRKPNGKRNKAGRAKKRKSSVNKGKKALNGKRKKGGKKKKNKRRMRNGKKNKGKRAKKGGNKRRRKLTRMERNTTTCSDSSQVTNQCLEDAVEVLKYLRSQVRTFSRRFARIKNFNKTIGNKLGKKGVFEESAKYLLLSLGGNINSASCGETGASTDKSTAVSTYNTLNNCSASIKEACTLPEKTLSNDDITSFNNCTTVFTQISKSADDCRTNEKYTTDGAAACTCWKKIIDGIDKIKKAGSCNATAANDGVKEGKTTCMNAFSKCRKAEDSAVQLVFTCSSGEVANSTKSAS